MADTVFGPLQRPMQLIWSLKLLAGDILNKSIQEGGGPQQPQRCNSDTERNNLLRQKPS
jgi:hypothetical protein